MKRRAFIAGIGSAAAWPVVARAQQAMPVIGFLGQWSLDDVQPVAAFKQGLKEVGYIEGKDVAIEYRWAQNKPERLPELAADLVRQKVTVIATPGSAPAALAAKNATATIPIVFSLGNDPVRLGLVANLNRPGGNVTGISAFGTQITGKRIDLLHALLPQAVRFAMLVNPKTQINAEQLIEDGQAAALTIGRLLEVLRASTDRDIDAVFESLTKDRVDALLVSPDPLFVSRRAEIITLAARRTVPAMYPFREDALADGLMSYGGDLPDQFRQTGIFTGRILKGEKPNDIPVERVTKFQFVINLQTAKALSLPFPPSLIAIADEVIE
jgi:putative tryptophan/tyrosine transport system substrate-binding protein